MTIGQAQKNAGPPRPMPTPKFPKVPVDTLMKAEGDREVRQEPEGPPQLRFDAQRSQMRVVARRDVLGAGTWSRHEFSSYLRTIRCETALWSDTR